MVPRADAARSPSAMTSCGGRQPPPVRHLAAKRFQQGQRRHATGGDAVQREFERGVGIEMGCCGAVASGEHGEAGRNGSFRKSRHVAGSF